jgi:hypothetical protein
MRAIRSTPGVLKRQSFEDIESLVTTLGVISALVFTFVVELQREGSADKTSRFDFSSLVCQSQEFRDYVLEVTSGYDVGTPEFESFSFSVPAGGGKRLDIVHELKTGIQSRLRDDPSLGCELDPLIVSVTEFLDFPAKHAKLWLASHPDMHRPSQDVEVSVAVSAAFSFSALVWSVFLYISLAMSPARESIAGGRAWSGKGTWALMFGWILLIVGCITFLIGHNKFVIQQSPYPGSMNLYVFIVSMLALVSPLGFLVIVIALCLFFTSTAASKAEEENERDEERQLQVLEQGNGILPSVASALESREISYQDKVEG